MVACGLSSAAFADTVTYFDSVALQDTNWTEQLDITKFNTSLGTLNSVTIQFVASGTTVISVTNLSDTQSSSGNARTDITLTLTDPGSFLGGDLEIGGLFPASSGASSFSLAPEGNVVKGPYAISLNSGEFVYTSGSILSEFTGSGFITLTAGATALSNLSYTGGNTLASQSTDVGATVYVTYDYTAVPEPTTALLVGVGAVGALFLRRRR